MKATSRRVLHCDCDVGASDGETPAGKATWSETFSCISLNHDWSGNTANILKKTLPIWLRVIAFGSYQSTIVWGNLCTCLTIKNLLPEGRGYCTLRLWVTSLSLRLIFMFLWFIPDWPSSSFQQAADFWQTQQMVVTTVHWTSLWELKQNLNVSKKARPL